MAGTTTATANSEKGITRMLQEDSAFNKHSNASENASERSRMTLIASVSFMSSRSASTGLRAAALCLPVNIRVLRYTPLWDVITTMSGHGGRTWKLYEQRPPTAKGTLMRHRASASGTHTIRLSRIILSNTILSSITTIHRTLIHIRILTRRICISNNQFLRDSRFPNRCINTSSPSPTPSSPLRRNKSRRVRC